MVVKQFQGVILVLLGVVCFSTKAVFIKLAYQYNIDATTLLFLRLLFALPFYIVILAFQIKKQAIRDKKILLQMVALGFLGYYVASWLDFAGLQHISASMERLILFTYPTFVVILSTVFLRTKLTKYQLGALVLTYIGVAVIVVFRDIIDQASGNFYLGAFMIVLSALIYAGYLVGSGEIMKKIPAIQFTSVAMIASCCGGFLHQVFTKELELFSFEQEVYTYAAIMAVLATVIPSFLISLGIKRIGASNAAIVGAVGPVSTIILAYLYLGESINLFQIMGTILVMLGVFIISLQKA